MKPTTLYILILMLATCLAACSINDFPEEENTPGESGTLRIAYRVAGNSVQTRTTEAGVDALNENTVTRLDFFAFNSNGSLLCHVPFTAEAGGSLYSSTYAPLAISEDHLSLEAVQGNTGGSYYLVANCPSVANITTLSALQAALTSSAGNPALITIDGTAPTAFIMDAKATPAISGKDITLSFDLRRAAVKIRIRFAETSEGTPTHCKLFQQAASTHVLAEAETYDNSAADWADFREITADFPLRDNSTDGQGGYVFYSYPNDWFNNTLYTQQTDGNYTMKEDAETGLHNGEPIVAAKQALSQAQDVKAPEFATGGLVTGPGTGTSDDIPAMLSNGESVMTARATDMFAPLLSTLNQAGGGVPIAMNDAASAMDGRDYIASMMEQSLAAMPNPVVSVEEINTVQSRVTALETLRNAG